MVGNDVKLDCFAPHGSHFDLSDLYVYWQIDNLSAVVAYYLPNESPGIHVNSSYKNRTHLSLDHMKQGDFSLHLKNVTPQDTQEFTCWVFKKSTKFREAVKEVVRLYVAGETLKAEIGFA